MRISTAVAALTSDQSGNTFIAVLLNDGSGVLQGPVLSPILNSSSFTVGDFDGDGKLDIAAAEGTFPGMAVVLRGNGDGTFSDQSTYPADDFTHDIVTADFNGDGILDLATANESGYDVSILLGKGDATFLPAKNFLSGKNSAYLTVADFNGDGKLDLAVSKVTINGSPLAILLGNGDGSFQSPVNYATRGASYNPVVGDFNGDGRLDIAISNRGPVILVGNGDGTFQLPLVFTFGALLHGLVAADFNGDGHLDLAGPGSNGHLIVYTQN